MIKKSKIQKQTIEFTKKQFLALLKAVYLGNWVANAYSIEDFKEDYESVEDYIFSFAPKFGFKHYVVHEDSDGDKYYPTSYFEEETDVHKVHEEYDEETLWDELADFLGERDFLERYTKEEIEKMGNEERFEKLSERIDVYNEEFEKFGIERIRVDKNK